MAVQPSKTARGLWLVALPIATLGCARGSSSSPVDSDVATDAAAADAKADAPTPSPDAPPDAGCAISAGFAPNLDGVDDLAKYPAAQRLSPGAQLATDGAAISWNATSLFITVTSSAFVSAYEPLHVYMEAGTTLASATATMGKEYSGLVPAVPFTATQLVAIRRVSDAGTGGYNGVFVPSLGWTTRTQPLDVFASADQKTLSVAVPWTALGGCPTSLRLAMHVVHGLTGNEWKDLVPTTHTPWQMPGGGYYEIDLTASPAVSGWTLR